MRPRGVNEAVGDTNRGGNTMKLKQLWLGVAPPPAIGRLSSAVNAAVWDMKASMSEGCRLCKGAPRSSGLACVVKLPRPHTRTI